MRHIGMDLDGTLVSFGDGAISVNEELIDQYLKPGDKVTILTNQGGVTLGYRTPRNFIDRLMAVKRGLDKRGVALGNIEIAVYHPKSTAEQRKAAKKAIYDMGRKARLRVWAYEIPEMRKPDKGLFIDAQLDFYMGDSDEDEQAAEAAGVPFIRVPRFMGGEG